MIDPLAFLTAAHDAAQRDAEAAGGDAWASVVEGWHLSIRDAQGRPVATLPTRLPGGDDYGTAAHIAHHDPAAVLRRVAADRKLIDRCLAVLAEDTIRYLAEGWGWEEGSRNG